MSSVANPGGFLRLLWARVSRSDLFFDAGAITFNVLVAFVPLLLLVVAGGSFVAAARFESSSDLVAMIFSFLPPIAGETDLAGVLGAFLDGVIQDRAGMTVVGGVVLLWASTRLVACLRVALRKTFDLEGGRGILAGKFFDLRAVLIGGLLLLLNVGVTIGARTLQARGIVLLGVGGSVANHLQSGTSLILSLLTAWALFFVIYWHVPARRILFRTAAVGATFTAVVYEILKWVFAWYVTSIADYSSAYGGLAVAAVLFFWIYYSAIVFILGGHVARTFEVRRAVEGDAVHG